MQRVTIWAVFVTLWLGVWSGFTAAQPSPAPTRYQFREPRLKGYRLEEKRATPQAVGAASQWLKAWPEISADDPIEVGSRVVLQIGPAADLQKLLQGRPLKLDRSVAANTFILQAPDAWTAAREAQNLATFPGVLASCPVARRPKNLHGPYSASPTDPYFVSQWHLENRNADGSGAGADLNVRAAWPFTRGEGITLAICDDGVDLAHPDLADNVAGSPHFDFGNRTTNGTPTSSFADHGTAVAGLAAAAGNNSIGVSGVAPATKLASLVIFDGSDNIVSDEALMDMFQYRTNIISVQNHSWGNAGVTQLSPSLLEQIAISNAVMFGRDSKGVVIVRSGGNNRSVSGNANDDAYPSNPQVIAVAAVRFDGRVASYSSPGASLLVAAPSGDLDEGFKTIFTTDRVGAFGYNQISFTNDLADYAFDSLGFSGTSAAAPQISGLSALLLSANPNLTYRDVQQILIHSARQFDLADPDLTTNGSGFRVSHNTGFGVPDAGQGVLLARSWTNRPALTSVTVTATNEQAIPDDGYRLLLSGPEVPPELASIRTQPSLGPHADVPTFILPLISVGIATNALTNNLAGTAALIQRGPQSELPDNANHFFRKLDRAADAGAVFAIVYNDRDSDKLLLMGGTEFVRLPAVFISQNNGEALVSLLQTNTNVVAQIKLDAIQYELTVTNTLLCEHVGVQVNTDHPKRGDVRLTLVSPSGTRSVMQHLNNDTSPGPNGWTYYSTHHFYESSAGTWTVFVSDEDAEDTGSVQNVNLTIYGVQITDADRDGLDDDWETAHFGKLTYGPKDDPDDDGYSNMREQIMGTDPLIAQVPFKLDLSLWNTNYVRLSWPSSGNRNYRVLSGWSAISPSTLLTNIDGGFTETEWFTSTTNLDAQFIRVQAFNRGIITTTPGPMSGGLGTIPPVLAPPPIRAMDPARDTRPPLSSPMPLRRLRKTAAY